MKRWTVGYNMAEAAELPNGIWVRFRDHQSTSRRLLVKLCRERADAIMWNIDARSLDEDDNLTDEERARAFKWEMFFRHLANVLPTGETVAYFQRLGEDK